MKKTGIRRGYSLIEVLLALGILGAALPAAMDAFALISASEVRIRDLSRKSFGAEWWFNHLEFPVSPTTLDAMPRSDGSGRLFFSWEVEDELCSLHVTALRVTLSVSGGSSDGSPFVMSRVYP